MRRRMSSNPLTSGFRMRRPYHARVIMDWRRAMAAILAVVMTVVMTPAADARGLADPWNIGAASISAVGSSDDTGVTVVSNGTIVTDPTIVAATQSATLTTLRTDSSPAYDTETVDDSSSDSADSGTADATDSTSADSSSTESQPQVTVGTTTLGGRDFEGQVTKEINGKTYILIGNEQQLRAIGSDKKVVRPIWKTETAQCRQTGILLGIPTYGWVDIDHVTTQEYVGDADLDETSTLRDQAADGDHDSSLLVCSALSVNDYKYHYTTLDDDGNKVSASSANTGQTYSADANYIIFRDIDLSSNAADPTNTNWTPLMFSGTMLGAVSTNSSVAGTLRSAIDTAGTGVVDGTAKPVISHIVVSQPGPQLDVSVQQGVGFFASIMSKSSLTGSSLGSAGTATVANLKLSDVSVTNQATESYIPTTLLGALTTAVGMLLDALIAALKLLTLGALDIDLKLADLLTLHKINPSNLATGAFAGRIYGDVRVAGCEVEDVTVSSVANMTGGFAGYVEGATRYDAVSDIVGTLTNVLAKILGVIPFLGLGDLVEWLLDGTLGLNALIPVGYYNPVISDSHVNGFKTDTVIGSDAKNQSGGFVGVQIGTIIENSSVTSANAFTVKASQYAGGFAGVSRNGNVGGLVNSLGVDLMSALRPQSLIESSTLDAQGGVTVTAANYAGGFSGAMANAYAINDTVSGIATVTATASHAGGFTGFASVGWGLELGTDDTTNTSLVKQLTKAITKLLSDGSGSNAGELLSIAGVKPSAILGTTMNAAMKITSDGDYAGGMVGVGSGTVIDDSSEGNLNNLTFWEYDSALHPKRAYPKQQTTVITQLDSVKAGDSYAGGIAGNLQPVMVAGLLNNVLSIGDLTVLKKVNQFSAFTVSNVTVNNMANNAAVNNTAKLVVIADGYYAGGAIGCATGGDITNVSIAQIANVTAKGEAGGFIGMTGPGDAVGATGLNVLGLIKVSGLLSVAQYSSVEVRDATVAGIAIGFTVAATGANTAGETNVYTVGGFYGQANSTKTVDAHVTNLRSVTADKTTSDGLAGGFVGYSTTGGLADVADNAADSSVLDEWIKGGLLSVNDLLGAVPYLIPNYRDTTVSYVNGGYVEADVAGGFAGDFQSGKINQFSDSDLKDDPTLASIKTRVTANGYAAVINIDHVTGGAYAGGFGGKVVSGALASAGNGGISLLGKLGTVDLTNLVQVVQGYVPFISYAGVRSDSTTVETTSGNKTTSPDHPGLLVVANRLDDADSRSGSAGGYIGYGSGVQVSHSDVTQLRYTKVTEPSQREGVNGYPYFDGAKSKYAITAKRYAGGYIGFMDIGSAASVGQGLKLLGNGIKLTDVTSVLSVVVSTIEHSDVTGDTLGYAVLASATDEKNTAIGDAIATEGSAKNPIGQAGGFAGRIQGGHIQDANAHNFAYIIGQITSGGYAGGIAPGDAASVLGDDASILSGLVNTGGTFASLLQDFVPTIRNSSTDAIPCGGVVRAQAASDSVALRGMAGGYVGHNEGGHIWGKNNAPWKSENDANNHYSGPQHTAFAARILSVYGAEFAGGFTGFMEPADTAETGSLSLLFGLIEVGNLLGALGVTYPTEENTQVTGPLRNLDFATWQKWASAVGIYGGYGKEFAELLKNAGTITNQDELNKAIDMYIYGTNVVAGRTSYDQNANASEGGVAGGYVGLMRAGTVTNGQAQDTKQVKAMRAAGGFAGSMEAGGAAQFGTIDVLGFIKANLSKLVSALSVFVPVVKSSSVIGYRRGMTVEATGIDLTHTNGFAGGYVGYASGAQIWGDATFADADESGDRWTIGSTHEGYTATGCNVTNLRRVKGTNAIGGYAGLITAAGVAEVNTNVSEGILQKLLNALISTPSDLAQVVQATVSTVRGAIVASVTDEQSAATWGFTVEGAYSVTGTDGKVTTRYARAAGGFAGSMKAVVAGTEKGGTATDGTDTLTVSGLRGVEGGQYAGGFFGQADVTSVASVAGTDGTDGSDQSANLLLKLIKAGNISALDAFRTYIYHANVVGVADGIQIKAHDASQQGILDSKRYTGAAGGFGGGLINGTVDYGTVTNLNSVNGINYAGGFIGHLGKAGTLDVDNAQVSQLLGATAGVLDIWGSHVDDSSVQGIASGFTVTVSHQGENYQAGTDAATGREVAGGFAGYADLARVSRSTVTGLKKVSSGEVAGGFVGETTMAYLVDAQVSSVLLDVILKVVNALVKLLYLDKLESLGVIDIGAWFPGIKDVFDLKVLAEGNVLYVNLFGLKIGVGLSKADAENQQQTDVAIITIGDSTIKLPCTNQGVDEDQLRSNLTVELIKANRTKATYSAVQGIADGYDVFGGGATQDSDGTSNLTTGIAGGFVGLNHEGLLEHDDMTYADTIRGASGLVGPFSGVTKLKTVYDFNSVQKIEGNGNTYHIYRDVPETWSYALTAARKQFTYGSHMDNAAKADGTASDTAGVLKLNLNRYDVAHLARSLVPGTTDQYTTPDIQQFADYKDAVMANNVSGSNTGSSAGGVANESAPLGVYVSAAQADLMLGVAVSDNNGGLTPEPDDGQDPCGLDGCRTVDLTLQKVWKDAGSGLARPQSITLQITATYTDANGETVTPEKITCLADDCTPTNQGNPWTVTLDASDGALWSDTWRKKISGLPVAFVDTGSGANGEDVVRYYTYTVAEIAMTYPKDAAHEKDYDRTPTEAGYTVNVSYDNKEYVATVTNSVPSLPNTGGTGTAWIVAIAVLILSLGTIWYLRDSNAGGARRKRGRHAGA
ncbi:hypothetical protein BHAP_0696 [Bifidobacterium hapali]|uniref:Gram-positive cocci surface proteins LPxTG domain-containing protein n=1 Tax=Bifidobacterium hapali TaxID=1630172 RepID=A0A261G188_9BIFI|nr:LPXTG cell wall anchor domain-containing protein [Bifidobacterium hapali]OZG65192.1 hypothetical protein BHAP_0696 [Bifidobacterium hapali]